MSKSGVGAFFCLKICRLAAARPGQLPSVCALAALVMPGVFTPGAVSADSHSLETDTSGARVLSRISEAASCTRYGINRVVELRATDVQQAPCEVAYLKPDEDQTTTSLWRAQNDYGYCESKFDEFIIKLEGKLQWDCGQAGSVEATSTSEAAEHQNAGLTDVVAATETEASIVTAPAVSDAVEFASDDAVRNEALRNEEPGLDEPVALDPPPSELQPAEPVLAAAVVTSRRDNSGPGAAVSMDDVRSRIPSGPYQAITLAGTDASDCPPGGSFFWNTRNPDQPVFEMGQDAEFTFSTARGRVGQGFALQAEPPLILENDDRSQYQVASLSVVGAGKVEARVRPGESREEPGVSQGETVCQYSLGGG